LRRKQLVKAEVIPVTHLVAEIVEGAVGESRIFGHGMGLPGISNVAASV
jgi:hypothetical protein